MTVVLVLWGGGGGGGGGGWYDVGVDDHLSVMVFEEARLSGSWGRNLKVGSMTFKVLAYKALVRPTLELVSPVWDPYLAKNIHKLCLYCAT